MILFYQPILQAILLLRDIDSFFSLFYNSSVKLKKESMATTMKTYLTR
jgi:hypothetical protein